MDLFLLKKILGFLLMPLSIISILLVVAIIFFHSKPKVSFRALIIASVLLILCSIGWVSDRLMLPLESQYSSFTETSRPLDYIVVLGCAHVSDNKLPATAQLSACSLERLVEAVRLYRLSPNAQIIASGGAFNNKESNAEKVKQAAILLGIPEQKIIVESFPKDTEEEAELIAPRIKGTNSALITNADHMPRAVNYFKQQGVTVIPAPASFYAKGVEQPKRWGYYLPSSKKLEQTTTAWYETLGLIVQWLKSF